jgi:hypothetical protein
MSVYQGYRVFTRACLCARACMCACVPVFVCVVCMLCQNKACFSLTTALRTAPHLYQICYINNLYINNLSCPCSGFRHGGRFRKLGSGVSNLHHHKGNGDRRIHTGNGDKKIHTGNGDKRIHRRIHTGMGIEEIEWYDRGRRRKSTIWIWNER